MKEITDCQKDAHITHIHIEVSPSELQGLFVEASLTLHTIRRSFQSVDGDLSRLRGKFPGPTNSPYEGGTFEGKPLHFRSSILHLTCCFGSLDPSSRQVSVRTSQGKPTISGYIPSQPHDYSPVEWAKREIGLDR